MLKKDQDIVEPEHHYDLMLKEIAAIDPDNLFVLVPGSGLHQRVINKASEDPDKS